jgi:hypothetical protein
MMDDLTEKAAGLSMGDARRIVEESLSHLLRLIRGSGKFIYAHEAGHPERAQTGYNMLRHCGTLWFMLRAVNTLDLNLADEKRDAILLALAYVGRKLERPGWIAAEGPCLALVTRGAVKTGGVGLALVMLAEYQTFAERYGQQDQVFPLSLPETIAGLQCYALAQIEDGDFLHKRLISNGQTLPFRSDYYTGEALLGLLATECRDPRVGMVAEALMARRYGHAEQSHWMAYAITEAAERGTVAPGLANTYLAGLIETIVANPGYRDRLASTPIACRSEALTRILMLADRLPEAAPTALLASTLNAAEDNLELQLSYYKDGQFWKGHKDRTVQIDYIQHNATAFLNLWLHMRARQ